ncbi:MAG TPA: hypothetical protein VMR06_04825 [Dokdonella sp.]|uniref:PepSY domain-containing protein n=1 Tax=Dokdonella sp. TaxID=2291710 RepID=UPI002D138C46|nr:hypothetical protein [Dokdonella sp.]HUD41304.1 hypothetical protein [Dokdonella sp.]
MPRARFAPSRAFAASLRRRRRCAVIALFHIAAGFSGNSIRAVETVAPRSALRLIAGAFKMKSMPLSRWWLSLVLPVALAIAHRASAREISVQEAVDQVQRETDGKVLSVQTMERNKRKIYHIKVLTRDGQVKVFQIRANQ